MNRVERALKRIKKLRYGDEFKGRTFLAMSVDGNTMYYADVTPANFFGTSWDSIRSRIYSAEIETAVGWIE